MLLLHHLTIGYGRHIVAHDLSAALRPGRLTALLGVNGVGKSTLLRTIAGLQPVLPASSSHSSSHDSPPLTWQGQDLRALSPRQLARLLSVVLTSRTVDGGLTASEVIQMGRIPYSSYLGTERAADRQAVARAMTLTQTESFRDRPLHTLSDGERQRVFIAKALAQETPLILLDEPTAYLDFPTKVAMLRLLAGLAHASDKAILISTHDVEPALRYADDLWLLTREGLHEGTPRSLADDGTLTAFFAGTGVDFDPQQLRLVY